MELTTELATEMETHQTTIAPAARTEGSPNLQVDGVALAAVAYQDKEAEVKAFRRSLVHKFQLSFLWVRKDRLELCETHSICAHTNNTSSIFCLLW